MKKMLCLFMIVVFLFCAAEAVRADYVDTWNYSVDASSKLAWSETKSSGALNVDKTTSRIAVSGGTGSFTTDGGARLAATFTHQNHAITNVKTPTFVDIELAFYMENAYDPNLNVQKEINLYMGFYETTYSGDNQDDIFYFLGSSKSFDTVQLGDSYYYLSLYSTFTALDQNSGYYIMAAERL